MKSQDFTKEQLSELDNFLKVCKTCNMKKINPSFLTLSWYQGTEDRIRYTKSNYYFIKRYAS